MTNLTTAKAALSAHNIALVQVAALDKKHAIGKNNQLAWHLPEDLQHFKQLTLGGVVVMGRKTFESMGKPLPNRVNWVITRDKSWKADGIKIAHNLTEVLIASIKDVQKSAKNNSLFIIGGGEIFTQSLPIADVLELTHVDLDCHGDAFYPAIPTDFAVAHSASLVSQSGILLNFVRYQRQ